MMGFRVRCLLILKYLMPILIILMSQFSVKAVNPDDDITPIWDIFPVATMEELVEELLLLDLQSDRFHPDDPGIIRFEQSFERYIGTPFSTTYGAGILDFSRSQSIRFQIDLETNEITGSWYHDHREESLNFDEEILSYFFEFVYDQDSGEFAIIEDSIHGYDEGFWPFRELPFTLEQAQAYFDNFFFLGPYISSELFYPRTYDRVFERYNLSGSLLRDYLIDFDGRNWNLDEFDITYRQSYYGWSHELPPYEYSYRLTFDHFGFEDESFRTEFSIELIESDNFTHGMPRAQWESLRNELEQERMEAWERNEPFWMTGLYIVLSLVLSMPSLVLLKMHWLTRIPKMKESGCSWNKRQKVIYTTLEFIASLVPTVIIFMWLILGFSSGNSGGMHPFLIFLSIAFPIVIPFFWVFVYLVAFILFKIFTRIRLLTGGENSYLQQIEKEKSRKKDK